MSPRKRPRRPIKLHQSEYDAILFALRATMSNSRLTNKMDHATYNAGLEILGELNAKTPLYKLGLAPIRVEFPERDPYDR